jgi:protein TBF1
MGSHKRRRDDSEYDWQPQQQTSQPYAASSQFDGTQQAVINGADYGSGGPMVVEPSDSVPQWQSVSPYPDVSSYSQQPYFYQQTHPSAYNSPWPPGGEQQTATYSSAAVANVSRELATEMPYFQTQNQVDGGFAVDAEQHPMFATVNGSATAVVPFGYASGNEDGVPRSDVPPESSTFMYEDASMHLKIQSLPILENLV